jgi:hypothetical protein
MKETSGEGFGILMLLLDVSAAAQMDLRVKQVIPAELALSNGIALLKKGRHRLALVQLERAHDILQKTGS